MNDIKIELAKGLENIPAAQAIRQKVFVEEQGFQLEFDGTDPIAWHAVLWLEQVPAATGRTFPSETEGVFTIGRIARSSRLPGTGLRIPNRPTPGAGCPRKRSTVYPALCAEACAWVL